MKNIKMLTYFLLPSNVLKWYKIEDLEQSPYPNMKKYFFTAVVAFVALLSNSVIGVEQDTIPHSNEQTRNPSSFVGSTITGWDVIKKTENGSVDSAVYDMERKIEEYPYIILVTFSSDDKQIKGKIKSVYKGNLATNDSITCELPYNLYSVQEKHNEYLSEMYILCKTIRALSSGNYNLDDCIVIPRTKCPFLPESAFIIALQAKQTL